MMEKAFSPCHMICFQEQNTQHAYLQHIISTPLKFAYTPADKRLLASARFSLTWRYPHPRFCYTIFRSYQVISHRV